MTTKKKLEGITYRQGPVQPVERKWGRFKDALAFGLNKTELYRLVHEGLIESYIYKFRDDAKGGVRMINLESLAAYLDKRAAEAKEQAHQGEGR